MGYFLCMKYCRRERNVHHFTQVGLLSSPLTDNKMKVHTGEVTCPKSPSKYTAKL